MGRSQNRYLKNQRETKKHKRKTEKEERKKKRKESSRGGGLENMIAYVDEFGRISSVPPGMESNESPPTDKQEL